MKVAIEWVTEVTEHHRIVLDEEEAPRWLVAILDNSEAGRVDGEFEPDDEDDFAALVDREGGTTETHAEVTNRYVSRIEVAPPEPASVGYHPHDAIRIAEENRNG